ncbi:Dicer-like protein 1 [Emydomyces testavorans]|uniref:Dicer-like protein 1 n=1 Tax=Emydomyces testavorans TaxID=2070801 RepID=A0AAF0DMH4_9EURO|nr:Dicer-like protein 1 [Emydomyces testavorans]
MRRFCISLPKDRILNSSEDVGALYENDRDRRTYTVQTTGAKLTFSSALVVLAHFASSLQYEKETSTTVNYYSRFTQNAFVCEVVLPEKSPIRGLIGKPASKKLLAKQSAAFETCLLLRKHGLLDDHFVSTYHKRLPAMRNARLAISSKKTNQYDMMVKPKLWEASRGTMPTSLYGIILSLRPSKPLRRQYHGLVFLTREKLPSFPVFPLYLENDIQCDVICTPIEVEILVSDHDLEVLTTFTLRIFQDIFHKVYDRDIKMMTYWLAPLNLKCQVITPNLASRNILDWVTLQTVFDNPGIPWSSDKSAEFFANRFVYDRWDGRYRYFTFEIEPNLRPSDPPPSTMARRRHMNNIMDYCLSLFKNARKRFLENCDWNQPVVRAELIQLRRNLLDKRNEKEKQEEGDYYICLEPLMVSAIPAPIAAFAFAFPAMISRLESYLIALEACEKLDLPIPPELALEALTKDSDNTEEHRGLQIHFQRGMGKNYERLEFLGDCFLKMATSISLFTLNPDSDEFDFHVRRMCLVCNQNLFNTAVNLKLYEFIRSHSFSRRGWYPEGLALLQGKGQSKEAVVNKHALADKTIADVCEALIGAACLSSGEYHRFDMAVKAVTAFVSSNDHNVSNWKDYSQLYALPKYQTAVVDAAELDLAKQAEVKLGYRFTYPKLLRSAFTHASYPSDWARVPCYQRLEFLGDSLLDMACVEHLYHRHPDKDPQWLTEHKMAMVSNKFLGSIAVKLGLHAHLRHFSTTVQSQITNYVEELQAAELESYGSPDAWTLTNDPPKCLPDMVEAYIGAIFIDSNFRFEVVEEFFEKFLKSYFEDMTIYDTFANKHPTTYLHNRLTIDFGCINYCLKAGEVPHVDGAGTRVLAAVMVHDEVVAEGVASSTRYAKLKASEVALSKLEGLPPFRFREKYGCDCSLNQNGITG